MSIFVRVVTLGGFAAAAREADISATMVAKHVQALEAHLGSRLLNRTTRQQRLTEVGEVYFDRCKRILGEVDAGTARSASCALRRAERCGSRRRLLLVRGGWRRPLRNF